MFCTFLNEVVVKKKRHADDTDGNIAVVKSEYMIGCIGSTAQSVPKLESTPEVR